MASLLQRLRIPAESKPKTPPAQRDELRNEPPLLKTLVSARKRGFFFAYSGIHFLIPVGYSSCGMANRRFHRDRKVRLHASGKWICTIGRIYSARTGAFVDKDWYYEGSQAEATEKANTQARQWELLCRNWEKSELPYVTMLGQALPHEPRWPTPESLKAKSEIARNILEARGAMMTPARKEYLQATAEFTYPDFIPIYKNDRAEDLKQHEVQNSTIAKDLSQMRQAAKFLPDDVPAVQLTAEHFRDAKQHMLDKKLGRRTVRNYLSAAVKLLRWIYGRYGDNTSAVPLGIEDAIVIRGAIRTNITIHGVKELKTLIGRLKGTMSQMDCLLALNCGMYPADIGRLQREEIDLKDGSIFWDREKEPGNDFRIHHKLWPESLAAVKEFLNDGKHDGVFNDDRHGKEPTKIHTRNLAFLDKGRPRYLMKPSGSAYDLVGRRWGSMETGVELHNLRKSTNEILVNLITHDGGNDPMLAVEEISDRFLGQKNDLLVRLYRTSGKAVYTRMNRFLVKVGDHMRDSEVFQDVK